MKLSDNGNLMNMLQLKISVKIMLTANIDLNDISDRLINGQISVIRSFQMQRGNVLKVCLWVQLNLSMGPVEKSDVEKPCLISEGIEQIR